MSKSIVPCLALFLAATGAAINLGCDQGPINNDAPITGRGDHYDQPWLSLGSDELRGDTRIGDAHRSRDESGILSVGVPVRNVTDKQLHVEYRITFFDANDREVNSYPGLLEIPARQSREATGNATSNRAERFHVDLSYPRIN